MSAAVLRAPAPWHRAVRAEAGVLLASRGPLLVMIVAVLLALLPSASGRSFPWDSLAGVVNLMFLFPLLYWRGGGAVRGLDQAAPMGPVRYELIRFAVGAAGALALLCAVAVAHAVTALPGFDPQGLETLPRGYVAALVIRGIAWYAFGSLAVLRSRGEGLGRVLLASVLILAVVELLIGSGVGTGVRTSTAPDGTRTVSYEAGLTLAGALTELAIAVAAVCASAAFGSRERGRLRLPWAPVEIAAVPARRPSPDRRSLALPRRPAPLASVAAREFLAQAPRMVVPGVITLLVTVLAIVTFSRIGGTSSKDFFLVGSMYLYFAAFFWPLLVRPDERRGDWDLSRPAGTPAQRMVRWAVALAWLELWTLLLIALQVGAEILDGALPRSTPAWVLVGVPMAAMLLYCVGTLPAMMKKHPVAWCIAVWLITTRVLMHHAAFKSPAPLSPVRAFAPLLGDAGDWSAVAAGIWLPVFAGLALAAIHLRVRRDRRAPALPSVRAVRLRPHRT